MSATQVSLWPTGPAARPSDPETSALTITTSALSELQALILEVHRAHAGLTDEELIVKLANGHRPGRRDGTVIKRRAELVKAGLLIDSGNRRNVSSGRAAVVWGLPTSPESDRVAGIARRQNP